jgi:hypothetical protein
LLKSKFAVDVWVKKLRDRRVSCESLIGHDHRMPQGRLKEAYTWIKKESVENSDNEGLSRCSCLKVLVKLRRQETYQGGQFGPFRHDLPPSLWHSVFTKEGDLRRLASNTLEIYS